jgi:hypothetical protein
MHNCHTWNKQATYQGTAAWISPDKLRLTFSDSPADWWFPYDLSPAVLTAGTEWLAALKENIAGLPHRQGDQSIGTHNSSRLWFWWTPSTSSP